VKIGDERPQLLVVKEMEITTPLDPYMSLRALESYSGCSKRWLADRLSDLRHPLPHYRLPGNSGAVVKILVRRSDFDSWIAKYRQVGNQEVERIVKEVFGDL
jgi:hypothetical protein